MGGAKNVKKNSAETPSFLVSALHICVLFGFAVAQPLYDLLSRHAEFLVAQQVQPIDVIVLILLLSFILPCAAVAIEALSAFLGRKARMGLHGLLVMVLVAMTALQGVKQVHEFPGVPMLAGAAVIGIAASGAYFRFSAVRFFLTILSPAIVAFPLVFVFGSPVQKIIFAEENAQAAYAPFQDQENAMAVSGEKNDAPSIVIVVFDEFPVTSLMDRNRRIDPVLYPNFAALAQGAFWFRNATSVSTTTVDAVPAILGGIYPDRPRLPNTVDYPNNIFTLLGGFYDLEVQESVTQLCPAHLCRGEETAFIDRMNSLVADLAVVYLHVLLPVDLTSELPVVTQTWKNFRTGNGGVGKTTEGETGIQPEETRKQLNVIDEELEKDRGDEFRQFVSLIADTGKPKLYFYHSYLPHKPWEFLPSGKKYVRPGDKIEGLKKGSWESDFFSANAFRRHLLQVGFVDRLLGELMDRLKATGLYEESLIIVTADHGVSFLVNEENRKVTKGNYQDILPVPLLIKTPGQQKGMVTDRNVETIDILPTVADVLDISLPWPVDGSSVFDTSFPERDRKIIYTVFRLTVDRMHVFEPHIEAKYKTLRRKISLFGDGSNPDGLYRSGPYSGLYGRNIDKIDFIGESDISVEIDNHALFDSVSPDADFMPAHIKGQVLQEKSNRESYNLVVAVNGIIHAMTQTFHEKGETKFSAVVPESAFQKGRNDVTILVATGVNGHVQLGRTKRETKTTYALAASDVLKSSNGNDIHIKPEALQGAIDMIELRGNTVTVYGWAADPKKSTPPDEIVIFVNDAFFFSGRPNAERPDVVDYFGDPELLQSGYHYRFPVSSFEDIENTGLRIFAISDDGTASELESSDAVNP